MGCYEMPAETGLAPRWAIVQQGHLVAHEAASGPDTAATLLSRALARVHEKPPTAVRVADAALRSALAPVTGTTCKLVVAPTPEIERLGHMVADGNEALTASYLLDGRISSAAAQAMIHTGLRFAMLEPWFTVISPQRIGVDIPAYGVRGAILETVGGSGISQGFMLYESIDALVSIESMVDQGDDPTTILSGVTLALNFDSVDALPQKCAEELKRYQWPTLSGQAAWVTGALRSGGYRPPSPRTQLAAWAITEALMQLLEAHGRTAGEWSDFYYGQEPTALAFTAANVPGLPTVVLTVPALPHDDALEGGDEAEDAPETAGDAPEGEAQRQ